jgi:hypothetical protein
MLLKSSFYRILQVSINSVKHGIAFLLTNSKKVRLTTKKSKEDYITDIATVLANIMLIGKEKTIKCQYYDTSTGFCTLLKFDVDVPTLHVANVDGVWRVKVDKHPEICVACPYWRSKYG